MTGGITSKEKIKQLVDTSFYSNALSLMGSNTASALLGFIFWILVARFYPAKDVGLASAAIATASLLASISYLGLGTGLIRFLPNSDFSHSAMVNTVFSVGVLSSILTALIFLAGLDFWSPALLFIREFPVYSLAFVVCVATMNLYQLLSDAFVAERQAKFVLFSGLMSGLLEIAFLVILVSFLHSFGFGIFYAWSISTLMAFVISMVVFLPRVQLGYKLIPMINKKILIAIWHYSFVNFLSILLLGLPTFLLPLMVVNRLGAASNAYFYIAWTISNALNSIPTAAAISLFAEGSHAEEKLGTNIGRSLMTTFIIMLPVVIIVVIIANRLLLIYGSEYSRNATALLRILVASCLPFSVNIIFLNISRVRKKLKVILGLSALIGVGTLGLAYVLLPRMGINGAGIAWLAIQGTVALVIVAASLRKRLRRVKISDVSKSEKVEM